MLLLGGKWEEFDICLYQVSPVPSVVSFDVFVCYNYVWDLFLAQQLRSYLGARLLVLVLSKWYFICPV
jgi:hypothetical protein